MRRIASVALATFGLVAALIGVGLMTIWAPGSKVSASASAPDAAFIQTDPGVIDLVGPEVTITAEAEGDADVTLAFGLSGDVAAWSDGLNVATVTGLKDWNNLDVVTGDDAEASPSASPSDSAEPSTPAEGEEGGEAEEVDPNIAKLAESDMWIMTEQGSGKISVSYRVADAGAISLIAASSDGQAPKLTLEWDRSLSNSYAMPIIVIGILVALIGILLLVLDIQQRRRDAERKAARDRRVDRRATRAAAETSVLAKVGPGEATTAEESAEGRGLQDMNTGHAFGAGILPSSLSAQEYRERELSDEDRIVLDEDAPSAADSSTAGEAALRSEGGEDGPHADSDQTAATTDGEDGEPEASTTEGSQDADVPNVDPTSWVLRDAPGAVPGQDTLNAPSTGEDVVADNDGSSDANENAFPDDNTENTEDEENTNA